jgi:hypothetical protein
MGVTGTKQTGIIEIIAAVTAGAIIMSALVYWSIQFIGMLEFLELAYG